MVNSIIWIVVLISSHETAPAEITHIPSTFHSEKECEDYLFKRFKEDSWGSIDKNLSGELAYWKDDYSGTISTYLCLEVHPD